MATESTPEENDPTVDNRDEYTPPPVAEPTDPNEIIDSNGVEVAEEEPFDITYDVDGNEVFGATIVEEEVE